MKPRYIFAASWLPSGDKKILDYGGGESGEFIKTLPRLKIKPTIVDIGAKRETKEYPEWKLVKITPTQKLPFKNNSFNVVTMLEVLEHVPSERKAISEVFRTLKPKGILIITSPHRGIFSWFDPGDFKFKFPHLHKVLYWLFYSKEKYRENFERGVLFGDISRRPKKEHHHYSDMELRRLLLEHFNIQEVKHFGLFFPFLGISRFVFQRIFGWQTSFWDKLIWWDSLIPSGPLSFYIGIKAEKR